MNSALKAGVLTLIIVAIGFGLMSFLGDDDGGSPDQAPEAEQATPRSPRKFAPITGFQTGRY